MRYIVPLAILFMSGAASAKPVSYAGGWQFMQHRDHMETYSELTYSPTYRDAIGARAEFMRGGDEYSLYSAVYNRLLKRWNFPDAQGNLYFLSGAGVAENDGDTSPAVYGGILADYETRRIFVSYENRALNAGDIERAYNQAVRVGIAPYVANSGSLHTWAMFQVDHHPSEKDNIVTTPMVRMFYKNVLGEVGYSSDDQVMANLMISF